MNTRIEQAPADEWHRQGKRPVSKSCIVNRNVRMHLSRIDQYQAAIRGQFTSPTVEDAFYPSNHNGHDILFVEVSRKLVAAVGGE